MWWTIIRNSKKEEKFVTELTTTLENIDMTDISSKESLENIVQKNIQEFWILLGINFSRTLILLNILKCGRTKSIVSN